MPWEAQAATARRADCTMDKDSAETQSGKQRGVSRNMCRGCHLMGRNGDTCTTDGGQRMEYGGPACIGRWTDGVL